VSADEVTWILDHIKSNWSAGTYSDIPLELIDRDESELLDGDVRQHTTELQADNYVGATLAERATSPVGTEYDHDIETVVAVRVTGLHHTEYGYVDPDATLPPATAGDPVPFADFVDEIRDTILTEREHPDAGRARYDYTNLLVQDWSGASADYGDFYRSDFDVVFQGYETLP